MVHHIVKRWTTEHWEKCWCAYVLRVRILWMLCCRQSIVSRRVDIECHQMVDFDIIFIRMSERTNHCWHKPTHRKSNEKRRRAYAILQTRQSCVCVIAVQKTRNISAIDMKKLNTTWIVYFMHSNKIKDKSVWVITTESQQLQKKKKNK